MDEVHEIFTQEDLQSLLTEAKDPATPAKRLKDIFTYACNLALTFTGYNRSNPAILENGWALLGAIARNPNTPSLTLAMIATYDFGYEVLANPILPFLLLEGTWEGWSAEQFEALRYWALQRDSRYHQLLSFVCFPHWRKPWLSHKCGCHYCRVCYPDPSLWYRY